VKKIIVFGVAIIMSLGLLAGCRGVSIMENDETEKADSGAVTNKENEDAEASRATETTEDEEAAKPGIIVVSKDEEDLIERAKQTYVDTFLKEEYPDATIGDLRFRKLGVYGESVVAVINDKYHLYFTEFIFNYEVDGFDFSYSNGYPIPFVVTVIFMT